MEYGAKITATGTVYMHGSLAEVSAFIAQFSSASALQLVQRTAGDIPGRWS